MQSEATGQLVHEGRRYTLFRGAHSTFVDAESKQVIRVTEHADVELHAKLAELISEFLVQGPLKRIELEAPIVAGVERIEKRRGVLMACAPDLRPVSNFLPAAHRFSILLQTLVALTEALPSFAVTYAEGRGIGAEFMYRHADRCARLVLLRPLGLFKRAKGTLGQRLRGVAEMMGYIDRLVTCVPGDAAYAALSEIKRRIAGEPAAAQAAMLKALGRTIAEEGRACETEDAALGCASEWTERIGLALDAALSLE